MFTCSDGFIPVKLNAACCTLAEFQSIKIGRFTFVIYFYLDRLFNASGFDICGPLKPLDRFENISSNFNWVNNNNI